MIKLNEEEIRQIAICRFHDRYFQSIYDCYTHALEVWLGEKGYVIVTKKDYAYIEARRHMRLSKILDGEGEATSTAEDDAEASKN